MSTCCERWEMFVSIWKKTSRKDKNTCTASSRQSPRYAARRRILHSLLRARGDDLSSPDAFPGRLEYPPVQYEDDQQRQVEGRRRREDLVVEVLAHQALLVPYPQLPVGVLPA